jgi:hypothetical protein
VCLNQIQWAVSTGKIINQASSFELRVQPQRNSYNFHSEKLYVKDGKVSSGENYL